MSLKYPEFSFKPAHTVFPSPGNSSFIFSVALVSGPGLFNSSLSHPTLKRSANAVSSAFKHIFHFSPAPQLLPSTLVFHLDHCRSSCLPVSTNAISRGFPLSRQSAPCKTSDSSCQNPPISPYKVQTLTMASVSCMSAPHHPLTTSDPIHCSSGHPLSMPATLTCQVLPTRHILASDLGTCYLPLPGLFFPHAAHSWLFTSSRSLIKGHPLSEVFLSQIITPLPIALSSLSLSMHL